MAGLFNLLIPHPAEKIYQRACDVLYELSGEEALELPFESRLPTVPLQLEIVGSRSSRLLSLHALATPHKGNLKRVEQLCNSPANTDHEKLSKLLRLTEAMEMLDFKLPLAPETLVYEFTVVDGYTRSVSSYDGDFTDPGWRWEQEKRLFRYDLNDLQNNLGLVRQGYVLAKEARQFLGQRCADLNIPLQERDFYQSYLQALPLITASDAMRRFVEFLGIK